MDENNKPEDKAPNNNPVAQPVAQAPTEGRTPVTAPQGVEFDIAIRKVMNGAKITREEWNNDKVYCYLEKFLLLHKDDGKDYSWTISREDALAKDWIVVLTN